MCFRKSLEVKCRILIGRPGRFEALDIVFHKKNFFFCCSRQKLEQKQGILKDVLLSEEGGRFYHEQNRNVIIEIDRDELDDLPPGYFWVDFYTLNQLIQINNCLNIQLRNLLSLLDR